MESGFRKCGQRVDCVVCSHTTNTSVHTCNYTGQQHKIKSAVNCTSAGIVYCLSCTRSSGECARCGPQYIGCTERRLKTRFAEHVGSATQPSQAETVRPVGVHFRLPGHSHSDMTVIPIEKVRSKDKFILEAREKYWIAKYQSLKSLPVESIEHGLNVKK